MSINNQWNVIFDHFRIGMCFQSADSGPCRAGIRRWAYDATSNRCYEFFYGGCAGNRNNFNNQDECMSSCGGGKF